MAGATTGYSYANVTPLSPGEGGVSGGLGRLTAPDFQSHHGLIGLVVVAVLVVVLLDRAGFRFAVAVGRK